MPYSCDWAQEILIVHVEYKCQVTLWSSHSDLYQKFVSIKNNLVDHDNSMISGQCTLLEMDLRIDKKMHKITFH